MSFATVVCWFCSKGIYLWCIYKERETKQIDESLGKHLFKLNRDESYALSDSSQFN